MSLKISISGVRGLVPESLTAEVCLDFAKAFGTYLSDDSSAKKIVVVGTDPRTTSEFIKGIIFSGLLATGCKVIDLGICPTPTVGIMVRELRANGGIIITASHNPLPWNGLKFVREDGIFLNEHQAKKLIRLYETKKFIAKDHRILLSNYSGIETHIDKILKVIKPGAIRRKKFKVALDCCNGAGSVACVKLLTKLGCRVEAIHCHLDRPFPHPPEPIPDNLGNLVKLVKSKKADIGFALDSDADRLAIVSDLGKPVGEELTLALATKYILSKHKGSHRKKKLVITNLSTTRAIDDIAQQNQAMVIRTKIGEVHVAEQLKELKGLIGGEGNGGVIYPRIGFNRDALAAMTMVLNMMAESGKSISELVAEIPAYHMIKKKIDCRDQDHADAVVEDVKEYFSNKTLILTEGVKVVLPTSWVHVRASNTEPVIRIIGEAKEKDQVKNLIKQVLNSFA
ncbi:phosphoglucosamine mutase [candidate division WOR-1 bacterium RIFCSPLOWO2_02_FULL_46_20]|uniref:Phosphoglucosamine mutase n=2 Tax=Saganbacteria TaxID=1703751 RepID=A0A1F4RH40_UNCSA|nr:MAG: phosphoglucosamine mutase [candidate division WOR-1 bacterium RIFCSPHIGHO2_02_FULL_45_12]OGC07499.1 MAG: phosphoglucosamine mutase [candidate division WOR-1 bacterium RIFCSPLOWO2_02_FULL_46_20]OGC09784.1 MAG: phosphoglucosamine mutase [candidate division WOR-1 bacterium RIFCSPLOWO2_12_FULL_45_9]